MMRYAPWALITLMTVILAGLIFRFPYFWPVLLAFGFLSLVGFWNILQRRHTLLRNYPLSAYFRWFFESLRPYLHAYIVEGNQEGKPFSKNQRTLVYERSKGVEDAHPFGTEHDVYAGEYEWLGHSISPARQSREPFRITIGGPQCERPYSASILNISAMSFGALSAHAIEALNMGAKMGNFFHDSGEGSVSVYHERHGGDLVWEIGSGYFGCRNSDGSFDPGAFAEMASRPQVKMIEIKLSQGAKPGHGGVLPAPKVTEEIARARGVPAYSDCISPAYHSAFSTPIEMLEFVSQLREASGGKPVGIKLCVGKPHEVFAIMKAMRKTEIYLDFIVVDGGEGGTGAAPVELSDHFGMPLREGLTIVRNALVGTDLKKHISIGASGKVIDASSIAMNCALGADWSNAARSFMFSLGCVQSMRCHLGTCPTGVATQDKLRQKALNIEDKAARVANFHANTMKALMEITAAAGLEKPQEFVVSDLYCRIDPTRALPMDQIYPSLSTGQLLSEPDSTVYANSWLQASADTFARVS